MEVWHRHHDPGGGHLGGAGGAGGGTRHAHVVAAPDAVGHRPDLDDLGARWWEAAGRGKAVVAYRNGMTSPFGQRKEVERPGIRPDFR